MTQYNNYKEITPERFMEILSLLCQSEFSLSYISLEDLLRFIGKCKLENCYPELVGRITILEKGYSPEIVDAINFGKRKKIITFNSGYIGFLEMDKDQRRQIIETEIEDLDLVRSFLSEFLNLSQEADQNQTMASMEYAINRSRIKEVPE